MLANDVITHNSPVQGAMLTTGEVAGLLGIHQNTVRRWSDLGLIRSFRVSRRGDRRYKYEDISTFLGSMNRGDLTGF